MAKPTSLSLLWLTENYFPSRGGMAQSCDRIVSGLRDTGVYIDLMHLTRRRKGHPIHSQHRGRDMSWPLGDNPPHTLNRLWNWLQDVSPPVPYTHLVAFGGFYPMIAGRIISAWLKLPLVTCVRGNDFDTAVFDAKRWTVLKETLINSKLIISVSQDKVNKIKALYPSTQLQCIANGIDLTDWQPLSSNLKQAKQWRAKHVKEGQHVLGLFGQIKAKKGGLFFLETLQLSGYTDQIYLLIVGDVSEEIATWLKTNEDKVQYSQYPFINRYDLLSFYPACDAVIIPSFYDGLPNVLLEAGALEVPILASTAGGIPDVITHGEHGYLFPPGNQAACRLGIEFLMTTSPLELKNMAQACAKRIANEFNADIEREQYIACLNKL